MGLLLKTALKSKGNFKVQFEVKQNLYYNIVILCVCVCVWQAIDSVPGGHTDIRPVSLEPVGPEGVQREKIFPEKWPVVKLPNKYLMPLLLFYGKIFSYIYIFRQFWTGPLLV
jgi:hypothetical protein